MNVLKKAPYEQFPVYFNYSAELLGNESIYSSTLSCINTKTLANTRDTIIDSSDISGTKVKVIIKNGAIEEQHKITSKIFTDLENQYEKDIVLLVVYDDQSKFEKQPSEQFLILNNFDNELAEGETISSQTVTAIRLDDEADFTSQLIYLNIISGDRVIVGVRSGTTGEFYRIAIQTVTSAGNKFQKNIIMIIYEQ